MIIRILLVALVFAINISESMSFVVSRSRVVLHELAPSDTVYVYDTLHISYLRKRNFNHQKYLIQNNIEPLKLKSVSVLSNISTRNLYPKKVKRKRKVSLHGLTSVFLSTEMFRDVLPVSFLPEDIEIQSEYANRDLYAAYSVGSTTGIQLKNFVLRTGISYSYFKSNYQSEAELSEHINYFDGSDYNGGNTVFTVSWDGRQPSGNNYITQWIIDRQNNSNGLDTITYSLNYEISSNYSYLEFPIILGYSFYVKKVRHVPQIGYIRGVYILPKAKATFETPFEQETITLTNDIPSNADLLFFSWHVSYQLTKNSRLFTEPFLKTSFNNIQSDNLLVRNQSVGVRIGVNFLF